jgi:hypothetical protein
MAIKVVYDVTVEDGKYRFVYYENGASKAFRHGERWMARENSMLGDKAFAALVAELADAREQIKNHADHEIAIGEHAFKAGYSSGYARGNGDGYHYEGSPGSPNDQAREKAWEAYTPPDHLTGGGIADKTA